jgi:hypothetical protein
MARVCSLVEQKGAKDDILKRYREELVRDRYDDLRRFQEAYSAKYFDHVSFHRIKHTSDRLENLSFESMEEYFIEISGILREILVHEGRSVSDAQLVQFRILRMIYDDFCKIMNPVFDKPSINFLEEFYASNGVDLDDDSEYSHYGLISISDRYDIKPSTQSKLYDKILKTHIFIKNVENEIVYIINELKNDGSIVDVAFRPDSQYVTGSFPDVSIVMEELERGKIFVLSDLGSPDIAKLYSEEYDNLWIVRTDSEITFEELCSEFVVYDDCIVTQVLHLQYKLHGSEYFIHHLDHEYIFYTIDEYVERQNNPYQKGEAKKRYKTFKIDNSKIPFTMKDGISTLYTFLHRIFANQKLLKEYFARMI